MSLATDEPASGASALWKARFRARGWLWGHSTIPSIRMCGRVAAGGGGSVHLLRYPTGQVVAPGMQTCHSVWACPMCSAKIVGRRGEQLQQVIDGWHDLGHRIGFVTLTLRHTATERLEDVWQRVMDAWSRLQAGSWFRLQTRWGVALPGRGGVVRTRIPIVRTVEVTRGRHGWHVHLHLLVFFAGDGDVVARWDALQGTLTARWQDQVERVGGKVDRAKGTHAELVNPADDSSRRVGEYLAKAVFTGSGDGSAIHREMTWSQGKTGSRGSRTPWQILEDAQRGDKKAAALWAVWEQGSRGRRQMWISGVLLDLFGLREESDEEAMGQADDRREAQTWTTDKVQMISGPPELVCHVPDSVWSRLTKRGALLDAFVRAAPVPGGLAAMLAASGESVVLGDGGGVVLGAVHDAVSVSLSEWRAMASAPLSAPPPVPPESPVPPGVPRRAPVSETDPAVLRRLYPGAVWSD